MIVIVIVIVVVCAGPKNEIAVLYMCIDAFMIIMRNLRWNESRLFRHSGPLPFLRPLINFNSSAHCQHQQSIYHLQMQV